MLAPPTEAEAEAEKGSWCWGVVCSRGRVGVSVKEGETHVGESLPD